MNEARRRFDTMQFFRKRPSVATMSRALPRSEVLRRGRIAILDDEEPEMLQDLQKEGLAVTHLSSTEDPQFHALAEGAYDLLLLDYGGIGQRFGQDQGLDVLKHLKRINPSLRILAFTARTFDASKADFFRLCDGVIKKDAGIRETLEQIEVHLSEVLTPSFQLDALARAVGATESEKIELERLLSNAVDGKDGQTAKLAAKRFAKGCSEKVVEALVMKAIELGITYVATGG